MCISPILYLSAGVWVCALVHYYIRGFQKELIMWTVWLYSLTHYILLYIFPFRSPSLARLPMPHVFSPAGKRGAHRYIHLHRKGLAYSSSNKYNDNFQFNSYKYKEAVYSNTFNLCLLFLRRTFRRIYYLYNNCLVNNRRNSICTLLCEQKKQPFT